MKARPKEKKINPIYAFSFIYILYNMLGLAQYPWIIDNAYDKTIPWLAFLSGLSGLFIGAIFWRKKRISSGKSAKTQVNDRILGLIFLAIFIISIAATIIRSKGIPFLLGEDRLGISAVLFNFAQIYGFWVALKFIQAYEEGKTIQKKYLLFYAIGILVFGYRSPVIILCLILFLYYICFRIPKRKAYFISAISGLILVVFSSLMAGYRVSQDYDTLDFFNNINTQFVSNNTFILPFVPALSMFDFSQETISLASAKLQAPMYGELFSSNYAALLPGSHWGARNIVGHLIDARWVNDRPMSITPTLQGALYIDFGLLGVFLGLFFIAALIILLKKNADRGGPLSKLIFCYVTTMCIMSIHNGYWDITYLFFIIFLLMIYMYKRAPKKAKLQRASPL